MSEKITQYEDEIELIDILRVIWKRKYLIMGGTLACGIIAAIISLSLPKIYMITMILEPGTVKNNRNDKKIFFQIASPENVKSMIDSGVFNNDILNLLKKSNKDIPKSLNIKTIIPNKSNIINVQYKTKDIATGIQILNLLKDLLLKKYSYKVDLIKKSYEDDLITQNEEIDINKAEQKMIRNNIINLDKRIDQLDTDIKLLNKNTKQLIEKRESFISDNNNQNNVILATLIINDMVQENFTLIRFYKSEVNDCLSEKQHYSLKLEEIERNINIVKRVIPEINLQKDSVQSILVIQPPNQSRNPVKPKAKLNILLAILAGGFIMLFISFFVEYLSKFRSNNITNNKELSG